jgi:hypothetical protein
MKTTDDLRNFIDSFPNENNYMRLLTRDKDLLEWVKIQLPSVESVNEKVYLLLNGKDNCKYGNKLKFLNYKKGYGYCNKADKCRCLVEKCGTTSKKFVDNSEKNKRSIRIKNTKKEKYGNENYNNRNKSKETLKNNYGVENPMFSPEIKQQVVNTNIEKYGVENVALLTEFIDKGLHTKYNNGTAVPPGLKAPFEYYSYKARLVSELEYRKFESSINPDKVIRGREAYHLDHKFSIKDGFMNNVPIEVISSWRNLQMLPGNENQCKNSKSSITLAELYNSIDADK